MAEFRMPSLGADMDEGTVLEWLVKPGDVVQKGDPVAVVDTAKAAVEVETFVGGLVEKLLVPVGQCVQVGTPLASIAANGAAPSGAPQPAPEPAPQPAPEPAPAPVRPAAPVEPVKPVKIVKPAELAEPVKLVEPEVGVPVGGRLKVSPYARKLARSLGVDLTGVVATGQRGLITSDDVRRSAAQVPEPATIEPTAPPTAAPERAQHVVRQAAQREAIARLMTRSKQEIPHYYLATTIDLGTAVDWLTEQNRALPVTDRLIPAVLLLKATALSARRHPELNGYWIDGSFQAVEQVHLGVAVSVRGGGLVAPAIHNAAELPLGELMAQLRDVVARARAGRLRRTELTEATITITNLGDQGVDSVHGVIYPPQVALVGAGRVVRRPWAVDGLLGVRPCVTVTLAADHRASDGFTGSRFLDTIDRLLQKPEEL